MGRVAYGDSIGDSGNRTALPLAGVRVIEDSTGVATTAGRLLGDLGADVIRIEPPEDPRSRKRPPFVGNCSIFELTHNANKRSAVIQRGPERSARLRALVEGAAIYLTDRFAGDADAWTAEMLAINPSLVVALISDFGQTGPYRSWAATEWVLQAMTGLLSSSGPETEMPHFAPGSIVSESAAAHVAWSVLLGYFNAQRRGTGEVIDASLFEAAVQAIDPGLGITGTASLSAVSTADQRARHDVSFRYPIFECADGYVRICVLSVRQWRALRAWLGEPAEFCGPEFDDVGARFAARAELYPLIARRFGGQTRAALASECQARGIPVQELLSIDEVLASAHLRERRALIDHDISPTSRVRLPNGVFVVGGDRAGIRSVRPVPVSDSTWDAGGPWAGPGARSADPAPVHGLPFEGLRVLDLGVIVVGAETGRLFADYGAEVIKVENRSYPDGFRAAVPTGMGESFARGHRNKLSIGLDLRHAEGIEIFKRLVAESDIILSNFKPGTMSSLGLGFDVLRSVNPDIIVVESSAFGSSGSWRNRMGYGPLVRSAAGLTRLWRQQDGPGFGDAETVYPDHVAARLGALAALAGVIARSRGVRTGLISISQAEVVLDQLADVVALESIEPGRGVGWSAAGTGDAPCGIYRCKGRDAWVAVTVRDDRDFAGLCEVLGDVHLRADPRFIDGGGRVEGSAHLDQLVSEWASQRSPADAMAELQRAGVPAGAMLRPYDQADDPHLRARSAFSTLIQPQLDEPVLTQGAHARFRVLGMPRLEPAPGKFEHTRDVMVSVLGMRVDEVERLLDQGILQGSREGDR